MPILKNKVLKPYRYVTAEKIMSNNVTSLRTVESIKKIYEALKTTHHGFPVTNYRGQVVGIIP